MRYKQNFLFAGKLFHVLNVCAVYMIEFSCAHILCMNNITSLGKDLPGEV